MKGKRQPKVAIVILTYSQSELLKVCINSIEKNTSYKNYKIFVVDNNSKDKIGQQIKNEFPKVRVIINRKNYGFSKGNNIGLKAAKKEYNPDYFLILNDDTEFFQKNWLGEIVKSAETDEGLGMVGCKLVYADKRMQNAGGFLDNGKITKIKDIGKNDFIEVDHIMGAFMLVKRKVFDEIGGFDEDFSPYLLEDTDWCLRAKKAGFNIKSLGKVEVIHHAHQSLKKSRDPKLFFRFKNDILFSVRHLRFFDALFRLFVYLPAVAVFSKESDEAEIGLNSLRIRKDFIFNVGHLLKAYAFVLLGGRGIQNE